MSQILRTNSFSSEKLLILCNFANELPPEVLSNVKSLKLDWKVVSDDMIVPIVEIEFK